MSKVVDISANEERMDTASRWILRMDKGLSDTEQAELRDWMAAHPKNAGRLLSMAERWDKMEDMSRLAALFPEEGTVPIKARPTLRWGIAVATVLVIATAAVWLTPRLDTDQPSGTASIVDHNNIFETAIGEQSTVTLSDGSVVVLNTNSLVHVAYSANARVLRLQRGEMHVDVADDASRPFSVMAGDRIVQAVGTAFSVEITDDKKIELVVTEGKVVVGIHTPSNAPSSIPPLLAQSSTNTVAAGEEMVLGVPDETATPVSPEEIEVKLSWREGRLIFNGEPLEAALAEVERYTTVEFVFMEDGIKTREVTGRFRAGDVEGLLIALRINFDITHERSEDGRVLLSSL